MIIEIALGIVLAVVILRYWKTIISAAVGLTVLGGAALVLVGAVALMIENWQAVSKYAKAIGFMFAFTGVYAIALSIIDAFRSKPKLMIKTAAPVQKVAVADALARKCTAADMLQNFGIEIESEHYVRLKGLYAESETAIHARRVVDNDQANQQINRMLFMRERGATAREIAGMLVYNEVPCLKQGETWSEALVTAITAGVHEAPVMNNATVASSATQEQTMSAAAAVRLMKEFKIQFDGEQYRFMGQRYDRLEDAVEFAKTLAAQVEHSEQPEEKIGTSKSEQPESPAGLILTLGLAVAMIVLLIAIAINSH